MTDPTVVAAIRDLVLQRLTRQWQQIEADLSEFISARRALGGLSARLTRTHEQARDGLFARIDLYVRQLRKKATNAPQPLTQNFYHSQIGAVQSGDASSAHVSMSVQIGDLGATERAIDALVEAVRESGQFADRQKNEIVETLHEARTEIAKPTPNRTRVMALLSGTSAVLRTAAAIRPAYESVRTAFLAWDVHLPAWP